MIRSQPHHSRLGIPIIKIKEGHNLAEMENNEVVTENMDIKTSLNFSEGRSLLADSDLQIPVERRRRPTPRFGYYAFFGRRKEDRYSAPTFFLLVSITGLNILDSLFTMMILDRGGWEANPVVKAVMEVHGDNFWIWKFALVSCCLTLLCLHSRYKLVKKVMVFLTSVYLVVVLYQTYLLRIQ